MFIGFLKEEVAKFLQSITHTHIHTHKHTWGHILFISKIIPSSNTLQYGILLVVVSDVHSRSSMCLVQRFESVEHNVKCSQMNMNVPC